MRLSFFSAFIHISLFSYFPSLNTKGNSFQSSIPPALASILHQQAQYQSFTGASFDFYRAEIQVSLSKSLTNANTLHNGLSLFAGLKFYADQLEVEFDLPDVSDYVTRADFWILCSFVALEKGHQNAGKNSSWVILTCCDRRSPYEQSFIDHFCTTVFFLFFSIFCSFFCVFFCIL